ncbi:hypothetical protein [Candidatus Pantoea formicae]|uniref:hypothetical protein n=1 Tax=Candidatus Pantoea formicae TaxID=2608355 RepID=UPI003ED94A04
MKRLSTGATAALIASVLLAGCDQAESGMKALSESGSAPTPVISPGYQIDDHGKPAFVYGQSACPDASGNPTGEQGCIIVDKQASTLQVDVEASSQAVRRETWTIERSGTPPDNSIRLKRPDNSYVVPWHGK